MGKAIAEGKKLKKSEDKLEKIKKIKKGANLIKKETKKEEIIQKLDNGDVVMVKKKKTRPSSKKRRFLKLLKENPQRDVAPKDLKALQIENVKKVLCNSVLSRGQRKRLKKKEKFINAKVIEEKTKVFEDMKKKEQ